MSQPDYHSILKQLVHRVGQLEHQLSKVAPTGDNSVAAPVSDNHFLLVPRPPARRLEHLSMSNLQQKTELSARESGVFKIFCHFWGQAVCTSQRVLSEEETMAVFERAKSVEAFLRGNVDNPREYMAIVKNRQLIQKAQEAMMHCLATKMFTVHVNSHENPRVKHGVNVPAPLTQLLAGKGQSETSADTNVALQKQLRPVTSEQRVDPLKAASPVSNPVVDYPARTRRSSKSSDAPNPAPNAVRHPARSRSASKPVFSTCIICSKPAETRVKSCSNRGCPSVYHTACAKKTSTTTLCPFCSKDTSTTPATHIESPEEFMQRCRSILTRIYSNPYRRTIFKDRSLGTIIDEIVKQKYTCVAQPINKVLQMLQAPLQTQAKDRPEHVLAVMFQNVLLRDMGLPSINVTWPALAVGSVETATVKTAIRQLVESVLRDSNAKPFFPPVEQKSFGRHTGSTQMWREYQSTVRSPMCFEKVAENVEAGVYGANLSMFIRDFFLPIRNAIEFYQKCTLGDLYGLGQAAKSLEQDLLNNAAKDVLHLRQLQRLFETIGGSTRTEPAPTKRKAKEIVSGAKSPNLDGQSNKRRSNAQTSVYDSDAETESEDDEADADRSVVESLSGIHSGLKQQGHMDARFALLTRAGDDTDSDCEDG